MPAVQFCGASSVIQAYSLARDVTCWAIFQGKEVITTGSDEAALSHFLGILAPGGSAAVYTLRMYKGDCDADDIDRDTPYSSCFNFKLTDGLYAGQGVGRTGPVDPIMAGIQEHLYKKVAAAVQAELNGENDEEEDDSIGGLVKGLLREPDKLAAVLDKVPAILSSIKGFMNRGAMGMPVSLAGAEPKRAGTTGQPVQPTPDDINRLQAALDILGKYDPDIIPHLEKLAVLARDKPGIYKMAIAQLDQL